MRGRILVFLWIDLRVHERCFGFERFARAVGKVSDGD